MGEKSCGQRESPQEAAQRGLLSPTTLQVPAMGLMEPGKYRTRGNLLLGEERAEWSK